MTAYRLVGISLALAAASCGDGKPDRPCAAQPLPVEVETRGDTSASGSSRDAFCGPSLSQADVMYRVDHGAGLLSVTVAPSGWDPVLELREDCSLPIAGLCVDGGYAGEEESVSACVEEGGTLVLVDGYGDANDPDNGPASGSFTIRASLEPCAEGTACRSGVGCAGDLQPGDTCEAAVPLPLDAAVVGDTTRMADDISGFGCGEPTATPDGVFAIEAPATGTLFFEVRGTSADAPSSFLAALRPSCAAGQGEIACGPVGMGQACVPAGAYTLVVEGDGPFAAKASFTECARGESCRHGSCLPPLTPEAEPNDDPKNAQRVSGGAFVEARLDPGTDVDFFRVHLAAGQTLSFSAERGCETDTVIALYAEPLPEPPAATPNCVDADRDQLLCADDSDRVPCAAGSFVASAGGDYLLRVVHWAYAAGEEAEAGGYVLEVQID
ncbi:MAG: hypothetical protein HYY06_06305 [Deltaproteobacteria bacterium]|nr:hypothetical protein [Deltaproteobacteria bacterium]